MGHTLNWLCWVCALLFLSSWVASAEDIAISTNSPQANSSAPMGLRGYRRYFANDSLIGRPVPCTREDKICFRHNLIFNPEEERCYAVGYYLILCKYRVNRTDLEYGTGRVVGACEKYRDPCPGYRMAFDDICYRKDIVDDIICGRDANTTLHPFGSAVECREVPATPITVQQPKEDGSCVIPDLRFPDIERRVFFNSPFTATQGFQNDNPLNTLKPNALECSFDQAACFSQEKIFVPGYDGCHTLRKQGPCAEDHVAALDLLAATQGRAEGTCVDVRGGCPKGYKRMAFDGECHEDRKITIESPGDIILNQFGNYIIVRELIGLIFTPELRNDSCSIHIGHSQYYLGSFNQLPPCGPDDMGGCPRHEIIHEAPMPEY